MLSILIVNWNTREHLRKCLETIRAFPPDGQWEVIVVDNASSDGSADMVETAFPSVRLVRQQRNVGYAAGNNIAFSEARGDFLLTLNPDTEFIDNSLSTAVRKISGWPEVGALTGKLLNPDGTLQSSIRGFPRPLSVLFDVLGLAKIFPNSKVFGAYRMRYFDYDKESDVEQPMGTFIVYRKAALDQVGLMDERFPIFFNEVDLMYRLHLAGWKIRYSPDISLIHHGGASTKQVRKAMIWESHRSLIRYYRKWHVRWWNAAFFYLFFLIIYLGAFARAKGWDVGFRT